MKKQQEYHFSWLKNPFFRWREGQIKKVQHLVSYGFSYYVDEFEKQTVIPAFKRDVDNFIEHWKQMICILSNDFFRDHANYDDERLRGYSDFLHLIEEIKTKYDSIDDFYELENYIGMILEKTNAAKIENNIILETTANIQAPCSPPPIVYKLLRERKNFEALLTRIEKNADEWRNSRLRQRLKIFEIVQQNLKNSYYKLLIIAEILAIILGVLFGTIVIHK